MTHIKTLISALEKFHIYDYLYDTEGKDKSLTVFLHTSVVTCGDLPAICSILSSYRAYSYCFAVTNETLAELRYLSDSKQSIFRKEAKTFLDAYYKGFIEHKEYVKCIGKRIALVSPSLPYANMACSQGIADFKYIVTSTDIGEANVITDCNKATASLVFGSKGSVESSTAFGASDRVIYKGRRLKLPATPLIEGGEASLYKLGGRKLIKHYRCGTMTDTKQSKIKHLMALSKSKKGIRKIICVPTSFVTNEYGKPTGIVIPRLKKYKTFSDLCVKGISNRRCKKLLKLYLLRIFELNLLSVVVSDVCESNFMCHKNKIKLVDADSFQVDKYPSGCYRQSHLTKPLQENLSNIDSYIRGLEQDMISFLYLIFNLLVGVKPVRYRNSTEHSNFVTHPFIYQNKADFTHPLILAEALENWQNNLCDDQRDMFIQVFRDNSYISPAKVDKILFS